MPHAEVVRVLYRVGNKLPTLLGYSLQALNSSANTANALASN